MPLFELLWFGEVGLLVHNAPRSRKRSDETAGPQHGYPKITKARSTLPQDITLQVNGRTHHVNVEPDTPLLYVLRNDLGLKAAKFGCGEGQCGACTVLVDGRPRPSCHVTVAAAQGHEITTLEGLGTADALDPVQQAFVDEGAVQCGFCTPGMIVAARALLNRHPHPTDEQIDAALSQNLCRCGAYDRVRRAIHRAAGQALQLEPRVIESHPEREGSLANAALPSPLLHTPDLDAWIRFNDDDTVTVFTGKVELGQDLRTAVAMIAADELDVSLRRIRVVMADTGRSPDEGYTGSSISLETSGNAIRYAAAEARHLLLAEASEELGAPMGTLTVSDGVITDPATGRCVSYWALHGGKRFGCPVSGVGRPKRAEAYALVGQAQDRLDLVAKVTGTATFVHDLDMPGMVHGRIVRPPAYDARLVSVDESTATRMPGVIAIVRDGSFLGVVAEREEQAVRAMESLESSAVWQNDTTLPSQDTLGDYMLSQPEQAFLVRNGTPVRDPIPPIEAPTGAVQTICATYFRPYHSHASLGPSAAVALMDEDQLTVWTHSQGVYPVRAGVAYVLGLPEENVRCIHVDGPGSFGHNGADDVALDAALLARATPGRPVSVKWTRAQENAWEPYGPATLIAMQGSLNAQGEVIDWNHDVYGYSHVVRHRVHEPVGALMPAWYLADAFERPQAQPSLGPQTGVHRNADPLYTFPQRRIVKHFLPDSPLRVSALRGLGSYANVFAVESFTDEMAQAAGADPVAFRLGYLDDERARAVIEAAATKADWHARQRPKGAGQGRGFAFAQYKNRQVYVAAVVDLRVDPETGEIHLERAVLAADTGQAVNPDSLSSQIEGGFVQSASWTLREEVRFSPHAITSSDWRSYPILRFREAPVIETVLLNRPGLPILGVGEGVMGPAPAAIANAVYDAVGIRLRRIPFTPERVREALAELKAPEGQGGEVFGR
ncbi:MAG: molybdopterin-dependent oxidoreductase [Anaerolineae bacterium]|nr:molybdopterin-dependent oxidoreductase [Anaerolineae bacterium]